MLPARVELISLNPDTRMQQLIWLHSDLAYDTSIATSEILESQRRSAAVLHLGVNEASVVGKILIIPTGRDVLPERFKVAAGQKALLRSKHSCTVSDNKDGIFHGKPFRQIRIMCEQSVTVTDGANSRDDLQTELAATLPELLRVTEVAAWHTIKDIEFVVGQNDTVISRSFRPLGDRDGLGDVRFNLQVQLQVNPATIRFYRRK